jgi:uncharacterized protein GlcG (DUF336 family)
MKQGTTRREFVDRGAAVTAGALAGAGITAATAQADDGRGGGPGPGGGGPAMVATVSLDQALRVIQAGLQRAQRIGVAMELVVVDNAGVIKAVQRMDGNSPASPMLAPLKAVTANAFRTATQDLAASVATDPARLASIAAAPGFTLLGGGVPLRVGGVVVGGVGVGGGSAAQDVDVALAAAAALS